MPSSRIDDRDKARRAEERRLRALERKQKEAGEEEAERERLKELAKGHQTEVVAGGDGDSGNDDDVTEIEKGSLRLHPKAAGGAASGHRRTGSLNMDQLLEKEQRDREEAMDRLLTNKPVNAAKAGSVRRGLDAEIYEALKAKEDPELFTKLGRWVEAVTNEPCFDLYVCLKSGVALCKLVDAIMPGCLGPNGYNQRAGVHLAQRDNIKLYLTACSKIGLPRGDLFEISDLHDGTNVASVASNLVSLSRHAAFVGFEGPFLEDSHRNANLGPGSTRGARTGPTHRRVLSSSTFVPPGQGSQPSLPTIKIDPNYQSSAPEAVSERQRQKQSRPPLPTAFTESKTCGQCGWDVSVAVDPLQETKLSKLEGEVKHLKKQVADDAARASAHAADKDALRQVRAEADKLRRERKELQNMLDAADSEGDKATQEARRLREELRQLRERESLDRERPNSASSNSLELQQLRDELDRLRAVATDHHRLRDELSQLKAQHAEAASREAASAVSQMRTTSSNIEDAELVLPSATSPLNNETPDSLALSMSAVRGVMWILVVAAIISLIASVGVALALEPWQEGTDLLAFGIQVALGLVLGLSFCICSLVVRGKVARLRAGYHQPRTA